MTKATSPTTTSEPIAQRIERYRDDFAAYARERLHIQTKDAETVPLQLNRVQRRLNALVEEDIAAGRPVRVYILKARQLGLSTYVQARIYHRTTLWPNSNGLVVAHEVDSAEELFRKSQIFYTWSPAEERPLQRYSNRKMLYFANPDPKGPAGLESKILVKTVDNEHLGAGMTLRFLHLSEFARYEKVRPNIKHVMGTLFQSVPKKPGTFIFIETTAQGYGYARDFWYDKKNGYHKLFVSWIAEEDYREETPLDPSELSDIEEHQFGNESRALKYVLSELELWYPELKDKPRALMHEALCRLAWRRAKIAETDVSMFRQEYPLYAEEAFLTTGASVFDGQKIHDVRRALYEKDEEGEATGQLLTPPERMRFDLETGGFYAAQHGPLRIYRPPKPNEMFVIGVDTAEGAAAGDASVAQVLRLPDLAQVAVLHERVDPDEWADYLLALGRMFNWAKLVIETNGPGFATNLKLTKTLFYPNLYWRETFDKVAREYQKKTGWNTNNASRGLLISDLRGAFKSDLIRFYDPETLDEMSTFVQFDTGKIAAMPGEHDDRVLALGLALQGAYQVAGHRRLGKGENPANRNEPKNGKHIQGSFDWWVELARKAALTQELMND